MKTIRFDRQPDNSYVPTHDGKLFDDLSGDYVPADVAADLLEACRKFVRVLDDTATVEVPDEVVKAIMLPLVATAGAAIKAIRKANGENDNPKTTP